MQEFSEAIVTPIVRSVVLKYAFGGETLLTYGEGYSIASNGELVSHLPLSDGDKIVVTYETHIMAASHATLMSEDGHSLD